MRPATQAGFVAPTSTPVFVPVEPESAANVLVPSSKLYNCVKSGPTGPILAGLESPIGLVAETR